MVKLKKQKEKLKFLDLKTKKVFWTDMYEIRKVKGRRFGIADAPSGIKSWRILGNVKSNIIQKRRLEKALVLQRMENR